MAPFDYDIGIIGAGAAGLTVASGAAQLGAKTLLVEKEEALGGDCLHFGCVPSKTLIKSARHYHRLGQAERYGLPPVDLAPVDFSRISERIAGVISEIQHHDSVERFSGLGVNVRFGSPAFLDEHRIDLNNTQVSAKKWVIATGSSASVPPIPGLESVELLTNKTIFSLSELPKSLLILGAGAIALEMAQAFARLGSKVTVLQRSRQVLSKEDPDLAALVMRALEDEGVTFHLGCTFVSAADTAEGKTVRFSLEGGEEQAISGSHLLVALGRAANVSGLKLENCGVASSPSGIDVDRRLRTSCKHIYAAGDVIGGYQFTHAAGYEGGVVLTNAVLRLPRRVNYRWMSWCTYSDPELASIGMNEKRATAAGVQYKVHEELFKDNDRAQTEGLTAGKIKLLLDKKDKPLGVQILGPHAGDLLAEWVAACNGRVRLSTLAGAIHPYPTFAEINKRVVGSVLSPRLFSGTVRKALKLLFQYRG